MGKHTVTFEQLAMDLPAAIEFARVDRAAHVIVSCGDPYVQLAFPDGWILGEAVSNHYLPGVLDEHDEVLLEILGWEPPGPDRDGDDHRNFLREWHDDTPSAAIAEDIVRTLTGVYMAGEADLVELSVFACCNCRAATSRRNFGDDAE